MPAGDKYELNVEAIYQGQSVVNVFHMFQIGSDGTGDPREGVVNAFEVNLKADIIDQLVDEYQMLQYRSRGILGNETQTLLTLVSDKGARVEEGLPPNSVLMTRNYGTRTGKKGTGRNCWTGIPESKQDQGVADILYLADWVAYETALAATIDDPGLSWEFQVGVLSPSDGVIRAIVRAETQPRLRTMRSRTIGSVGA